MKIAVMILYSRFILLNQPIIIRDRVLTIHGGELCGSIDLRDKF